MIIHFNSRCNEERNRIIAENNSTKGPIYRLNQNNQDAKSRLERKSRFNKNKISAKT